MHHLAIFHWISPITVLEMPNPIIVGAPKTLNQLVEICRTAGYFKMLVNQNALTTVESLPLGRMLSENIRREWCRSFDSSVSFLSDLVPGVSVLDLKGGKCAEQLRGIQVAMEGVPFGLAECVEGIVDDINVEGNVRIITAATRKLACSYFTSEKTGKEFFYQLQRQRKIWWMKVSFLCFCFKVEQCVQRSEDEIVSSLILFSLSFQIAANPGRFFLSEVITSPCGTWNSSILSKFDFGNVELERFELVPPSAELILNETARGQQKVRANIVRSVMCLDTSSIATLMDAIESAYDQEICLNRKIAPYQCCIFSVLSHSGDDDMDNFSDLTKFIRLHLQRGGLSVPLETKDNFVRSTIELEHKFRQTDSIGVPYVLILDNESLQTGLLKLRNRDTTLAETIHLSDVPKYLLNIFGIFTENK